MRPAKGPAAVRSTKAAQVDFLYKDVFFKVEMTCCLVRAAYLAAPESHRACYMRGDAAAVQSLLASSPPVRTMTCLGDCRICTMPTRDGVGRRGLISFSCLYGSFVEHRDCDTSCFAALSEVGCQGCARYKRPCVRGSKPNSSCTDRRSLAREPPTSLHTHSHDFLQ